jgi:hypothetical protein
MGHALGPLWVRPNTVLRNRNVAGTWQRGRAHISRVGEPDACCEVVELAQRLSALLLDHLPGAWAACIQPPAAVREATAAI